LPSRSKAPAARRPSADLFPTEDPLPADQLIGRAGDVSALVGALEGRAHRILAAPRRTGKTSICRAVLEALAERGFYTLSVDLWEAADQAEFASALVARTVANRPALRRLPHALRERGRQAADAVQMVSRTKLADELGQEVELAWKPALADRDVRRYLRFALELPQRIAERDDRRIVVFFDEFQSVLDLERSASGRDAVALQKLMRTVFQGADRCSFMFAGSIEHLIREVFSSDQPLGHFGGFHDLSPIGPDDWREGLRARFALDECEPTPDALTLLVELGELHPRTTMLIAQRAHIAAVEQGLHAIDGDLIRLGHAEARRQERARHQSVVDRIRRLGGRRTGPLALKTIKKLGRGEGLYAGVDDKKAVNRAVDRLRDAGFIERADDSWRIQDPLLRAYLADLDPS